MMKKIFIFSVFSVIFSKFNLVYATNSQQVDTIKINTMEIHTPNNITTTNNQFINCYQAILLSDTLLVPAYLSEYYNNLYPKYPSIMQFLPIANFIIKTGCMLYIISEEQWNFLQFASFFLMFTTSSAGLWNVLTNYDKNIYKYQYITSLLLRTELVIFAIFACINHKSIL